MTAAGIIKKQTNQSEKKFICKKCGCVVTLYGTAVNQYKDEVGEKCKQKKKK